jgi:nitrate reductase gamma subunit
MAIPVGRASRMEPESSDVEFEESNLWDGRVVRWMKQEYQCSNCAVAVGGLSFIVFAASTISAALPDAIYRKEAVICSCISGAVLVFSVGSCLLFRCIKKKPETIPLTTR